MFRIIPLQEQLITERGRISELNNNQIELAQETSEREIQEIIQGRQISDLEIQILELQSEGVK